MKAEPEVISPLSEIVRDARDSLAASLGEGMHLLILYGSEARGVLMWTNC
jgi:hypothetical protein